MLGSFGVESSKDLTVTQFARVMERFKACGFEARGQESTDGARPKASIPSVAAQKRRLVVKMDGVLKDLGLPWSYADGIASQMFGVGKVQWLEVGKLYKVLQALMVYQKRELARQRKRTTERSDG